MAAAIKQYRPGFFTGYENEVKSFNSLEELFAIEFVNNFTKNPINEPDPRFHKFSKSTPSEDTTILMAEYEEGKVWWVVGYLSDADEIVKELPLWVPKR